MIVLRERYYNWEDARKLYLGGYRPKVEEDVDNMEEEDTVQDVKKP